MNRIDRCFEELKANGKKALITFVTAGDPDLATTESTVLEMFENGSDIIELGVPFSDPIAEGITIQESSLRALKGGVNLNKIFDTVSNLRAKTDKPLILMMYINTIYGYGVEKFFTNCATRGIDGIIVPDIPYEEIDEIRPEADKYGIHVINLVSPASKDRVKKIAADSKGFLYCVSSNGVTGTRQSFSTDFDAFFNNIKENATCPYCVGFGISNPEQATAMAQYCDGIIVGSAVVKIMEQNGKDSPKLVGQFVKSLKDAI